MTCRIPSRVPNLFVSIMCKGCENNERRMVKDTEWLDAILCIAIAAAIRSVQFKHEWTRVARLVRVDESQACRAGQKKFRADPRTWESERPWKYDFLAKFFIFWSLFTNHYFVFIKIRKNWFKNSNYLTKSQLNRLKSLKILRPGLKMLGSTLLNTSLNQAQISGIVQT